MPLKLYPPRPKNPSWQIRGTYLGRHVERSSRTGKRAVAVKVLKAIERQIERGEFSVAGDPTFASAAAAYMRAGGERTYLKRLLAHFGDTALTRIDQAAIDAASTALYPCQSAATQNRQVYTPVSAVLRHAGASLNLRRPRGAGGNKQTAWLWPEQAEAIFAEAEKLSPDFSALCITLCYTGMRLSEALGLTWNDVRLAEGFAYVPDTKSGEPRAVFLPPVAVAAVANIAGQSSDNDRQRTHRVFRLCKSGHLYSLLRVVSIRAGVELPVRSAFHIFRHTWGTWMRRYAGLDAKGLVATGAWKDEKSASRYAHAVVSEESKRAFMLPVGALRGKRQIG